MQYQIGTKQRRITLGRTKAISEREARATARTLLAKIRLGGDPQADKLKVRAEAAITLGAVVKQFLERQEKKLRARSYVEQRRHLEVDWKGLHSHQINAVNRAIIAQELGKLIKTKGPSVADHARRALSTLFTWAWKEGLADGNPVGGTNRPIGPVERDRVLSNAELREIWNTCGDDDYGRMIKLLALTGQRRDEIASLRWSEIDLDEALIVLPKERTKNHRAHEVPLSDAALALLPPQWGDSDYVFGGRGGYRGFSTSKKRLDDRILKNRREEKPDAEPMPDWRVHDLRRTAATRMADLGVQPHIIEAVLNHISGHKAGVAGIYNRASYRKEKREALTLWAEHVLSVVTGTDPKVSSLDAERRKRARHERNQEAGRRVHLAGIVAASG